MEFLRTTRRLMALRFLADHSVSNSTVQTLREANHEVGDKAGNVERLLRLHCRLAVAEVMKMPGAPVTIGHEMNQPLVIFLAPGSHTATDLLK
jgi:hypothetical protein